MILYDHYNFDEGHHDAIMGTQFLRKQTCAKFCDPDYSIEWDDLVEMGFFHPINDYDNEWYERTDLGMAYVQEVCNRIDEINQEEHPNIPLISSEVGLYLCQQDTAEPLKVIVDSNSCCPIVTRFPRYSTYNDGISVALMSARLLWDIEVGDADNHILLGSRLVSGNGFYSYSFNRQTKLFILDESNTT